jgi:cholesterol transport system auxiliary component
MSVHCISLAGRCISLAGRSLSLAGSLLSAFALAGCLSGPPPADHFYRLEVGDPAGPVEKPLGGTLHVDRFRVDAVLGDRHMLYRQDSDTAEIRQFTYHYWSDPPSLLVQTELTEYLQEARASGVVMDANARVKPDHTITGRIRRFDQVVGSEPGVVVEIDVSVRAAGAIVLQKSYIERRTASADTPSAAADAFAEAVQAVFVRLLADVDARSS